MSSINRYWNFKENLKQIELELNVYAHMDKNSILRDLISQRLNMILLEYSEDLDLSTNVLQNKANYEVMKAIMRRQKKAYQQLVEQNSKNNKGDK